MERAGDLKDPAPRELASSGGIRIGKTLRALEAAGFVVVSPVGGALKVAVTEKGREFLTRARGFRGRI